MHTQLRNLQNLRDLRWSKCLYTLRIFNRICAEFHFLFVYYYLSSYTKTILFRVANPFKNLTHSLKLYFNIRQLRIFHTFLANAYTTFPIHIISVIYKEWTLKVCMILSESLYEASITRNAKLWYYSGSYLV